MEKIKDFLRNAAIPIAGGIIGAFIGIVNDYYIRKSVG